MREPRQVETAWSRLVRVVSLAPDRSHGLRGGMRRMGATCTAAQTHMHSRRIPSQEYDRNGAESGGGDALPSEWRPLLRSDRLLGSPCADRQSFGCSPAIEGISIQYPPKQARFSDHMSGSADHPPWRPNWESSWQTAFERTESVPKRCEWPTLPRHAVFSQRVGLGGPHQLPAESGCRQQTKGW